MKTKLCSLMGLFLIVTVLLMATSVYADTPDEPHEANAMWVEPSTLDKSTEPTEIGDTFNVTVWVNITSVPSGNDEVGSWQFRLWYKKDILHVISAVFTAGTKSQFFEDINTFPVSPVYGSNATHAYVQTGEIWNPMMPEPNPLKSIPAYGSLAEITFNITAIPPEGETYNSTLGLDRALCKCEDDEKNQVLENYHNGYYTIPEFSNPIILVMATSLTLATILLKYRLRKLDSRQSVPH